MASGTSAKKPVNRKLAYMALAGVGVIGLLAIIAVMAEDPAAQRIAREELAKRQELEGLPQGSLEAGKDKVDEAAEQQEREFQQFLGESGAGSQGGSPLLSASGGSVPGLDPQMLRDLEALDQAQREVMRARGNGSALDGTTRPENGEQWLGIEQSSGPGLGAQGGIGAMYEGYDKGDQRITGDRIDFTSDGSLSSDGDSRATGVYETTRPKNPPSARIVNQGVVIPAVLQSAIDTRNSGQIMAVVSRTIFDSRTHRIPLVPQGSKLIGTFGTQVEPGVDRIPGTFSRLILPDGRSIELQSSQASALDGSNGIAGRYHSNIARAIGPAFVVAAFGQWVDRRFPEETQTNTNGMTYETPSVMQQVSPKISEAVTTRYSAAKPYFTVKPGQEVRIILTQDIEIPVGGQN